MSALVLEEVSSLHLAVHISVPLYILNFGPVQSFHMKRGGKECICCALYSPCGFVVFL